MTDKTLSSLPLSHFSLSVHLSPFQCLSGRAPPTLPGVEAGPAGVCPLVAPPCCAQPVTTLWTRVCPPPRLPLPCAACPRWTPRRHRRRSNAASRGRPHTHAASGDTPAVTSGNTHAHTHTDASINVRTQLQESHPQSPQVTQCTHIYTHTRTHSQLIIYFA